LKLTWLAIWLKVWSAENPSLLCHLQDDPR
jgi:hypothetical protein